MGVDLGSAAGASVSTLQANAAAAKPLSDVIIELIPRNPLESAVRALDGEMLALMVFSLIFGVAITRLPTSSERHLLIQVLDQVFGACMVIVAQRVSTIINADQILVIEDGRQVGLGTHHELLEHCPTYAEIVESQLTEEEAA